MLDSTATWTKNPSPSVTINRSTCEPNHLSAPSLTAFHHESTVAGSSGIYGSQGRRFVQESDQRNENWNTENCNFVKFSFPIMFWGTQKEILGHESWCW